MAAVMITLFILLSIAVFVEATFFLQGRQFALRDRLQKADAIVVLAGTRGNIKYLQGKIRTAVRLYQQGWAPYIICSGGFSVKITETPTHFTADELQAAVDAGRLQPKDVPGALKSWDKGLGAGYMKQQAIEMGVPADALLLEDTSLHTKENAEHTLALLQKKDIHSTVILVTSPFHQKRTYLTFLKAFQPYNVRILNYYAETGEWHPATWFFSKEHRKLVKSEIERITLYRKKGDLL